MEEVGRENFGELYDAYSQKIYRYIYYRTQHKQTTEDLTSSVFLKALEHIGRYDPTKGSFSSWLYRIAHNAVIDHYRTETHTEDIETIFDLADDTNIERDADVSRNLARVREYLNKLNPEQRNIVIMRVWDELSYKEIADITGKSEESSRMVFSRTVRKLVQDLGSLALLYMLTLFRSN